MRRLILITLGLLGGALATPISLDAALQVPTSATKTAVLKLQRAELTHQKALVQVQPSVSLTGNLNLTGHFDSEPTTTGTLSGKASWDVAPWATAPLNLQSAERSLQQARWDAQTALGQAKVQVMEQYFQVETAREQVDAARLQLQRTELALQTAEKRHLIGQATQDTLETARLNVLKAQNTLKSSQGTLQGALQSLSLLLGRDVQDGDTLTPDLSLPAFAGPEVLLRKADQHPNVQKAKLSLQDSEDAITAQQLQSALPDLTVTGKFGQLTGGWNISTDFALKSGSVGVSASYPVGSSGTGGLGYSVGLQLNVPLDPTRPYTLQNLVAQRDLQLLAVEDALTTVKQDITTQYHSYLQRVQQVEEGTLQVRQAGQELEIQQKRLSLGLITPAELLDAEISLQSARFNLAQSSRNAYLQAFKLRLATGESL